MIDISSVAAAFIALFIVMDPFSSVPVFLALTRKYSQKDKLRAATVATAVAAGVFLGFLFLGPLALSFLGIRFESFQIAGGLLMLLIAVSFALGIEFGKSQHAPVEAVIIGVPLLSGPGTMLTSMLLRSSFGEINVALAGIAACLASYAILLASSQIYRLIGKSGLEILSRVMGVLLAAFAVEYIRKGFGL
ncbi:MAG: MarC family protein [Candidatus Micrarchaeota archaeon]|nr:MarC family protein [Candidatus Micrarchaeota archaeon]